MKPEQTSGLISHERSTFNLHNRFFKTLSQNPHKMGAPPPYSEPPNSSSPPPLPPPYLAAKDQPSRLQSPESNAPSDEARLFNTHSDYRPLSPSIPQENINYVHDFEVATIVADPQLIKYGVIALIVVIIIAIVARILT
jgi:hypothetical protein